MLAGNLRMIFNDHARMFCTGIISEDSEELIESIVSGYPKAEAMDVVSRKKPIGTFIRQYDEADWQFLKRMASIIPFMSVMILRRC